VVLSRRVLVGRTTYASPMPEYPNPKLYTGAPIDPPTSVAHADYAYAELDVTTNFSFLRGASHPDELVYTAAMLGYKGLAITDVNTLAGAVRAYAAAKEIDGFKLLIGARLVFTDGSPDLLAWCPDRTAYGNLCRLLTLGKRRAPKGECHLTFDDFLEHSDGLLAAVAPDSRTEVDREKCHPEVPRRISRDPAGDPSDYLRVTSRPPLRHSPARTHESDFQRSSSASASNVDHYLPLLREALGRDRLSLAVTALCGPDDTSHLRAMRELSVSHDVPLLATNHVHYHDPGRRRLQDIVTCIRHGCTIHDAGHKLFPNGEYYLKSPEQMHRLFEAYPGALRRGVEIAERCNFNMGQLRYEYPEELVPPGLSNAQYLAQLAWAGADERYPEGVPMKVRAQVTEELELIAKLQYEPYFLTVQDVVKRARELGILCQGRGSAANSAVCYCLEITSVDPNLHDLLFARFLSEARNEPPDIDVDFEHERREEVIQYIYGKYGRDRSGMTATVISYRGRSAVRDVGKALALPLDRVDAMAKRLDWWDRGTLNPGQLRECGIDPSDATVRNLIDLTAQLLGFPRHLSQHTGGMVMTRGPLCELVPIENASMENRTVVEWDKDDIHTLGILKVDVLALGMLTAISKGLALLNARYGCPDALLVQKREPNGSAVGSSVEGEPHDEGENLTPSPGTPGEDGGEGAPSFEPEDASFAQGTETGRAAPNGAAGDPPSRSVRTGTVRLSPLREQHAFKTRKCTLTLTLSQSTGREDKSTRRAKPFELHTLPFEDPLTYEMMCDADTIGVFQIESRAQMSMLPRLQPRRFYDIVIEVAIVRPGPIQGNMVHPYLRRRSGMEKVTFPKKELEEVLKNTLGVPLFQEQAMKVVMVAANFTGTEADNLRRAMAAWRKSTALDRFHDDIVERMAANGYTREFAEQVFEQIRGFGEYGFPESHAASFAKLVYASAWLKRHHPAVFCCAMLNSQPMGFYQPAQLVRDAKEHGVPVRPVDVNFSDWDCTLEEPLLTPEYRGDAEEEDRPKRTWGVNGPSTRLGFRQVKGLREDHARKLVLARERAGPFASVTQFHHRTHLPVSTVRRLAEADSFGSLGLTRRRAVWEVLKLKDEEAPLFDREQEDGGWKTEGGGTTSDATLSLSSILHLPSSPDPDHVPLPPMPIGQEVMTDYATAGLSLKRHPVALIRPALRQRKILTCARVLELEHGTWTKVAGLVLIRQRPGTASGVVFETLEDETGVVNLILWPKIYDQFRPAARYSSLLQADGYVQKQGKVIHVLAKRLFDLSGLLVGLEQRSRDFH
jgi:error-prone DNA polymerase